MILNWLSSHHFAAHVLHTQFLLIDKVEQFGILIPKLKLFNWNYIAYLIIITFSNAIPELKIIIKWCFHTYFSIPTNVSSVPAFVSTSKSNDRKLPELRAKFTDAISSNLNINNGIYETFLCYTINTSTKVLAIVSALHHAHIETSRY